MEEFLSQISLSDVVFIIVIVAVIFFVAKKMIGLAVAVCAILLIFQIGFTYAGDDINNLLGEYLDPETAATISNFFDDFEARRQENAVVDADKVYEGMENAVDTGVEIVKDIFTPENIKAFSASLANALREAGYDEITMDELVNIVADELGTTPDDEVVQEIATEVIANVEAGVTTE